MTGSLVTIAQQPGIVTSVGAEPQAVAKKAEPEEDPCCAEIMQNLSPKKKNGKTKLGKTSAKDLKELKAALKKCMGTSKSKRIKCKLPGGGTLDVSIALGEANIEAGTSESDPDLVIAVGNDGDPGQPGGSTVAQGNKPGSAAVAIGGDAGNRGGKGGSATANANGGDACAKGGNGGFALSGKGGSGGNAHATTSGDGHASARGGDGGFGQSNGDGGTADTRIRGDKSQHDPGEAGTTDHHTGRGGSIP